MICKFCGKQTTMTARDSNGNLYNCCLKCKRELGYDISVAYKPREGEKAMDPRSFKFYIAGVQHHDAKDVLNEMAEGEMLEIVPEPTNKYDPNAIRLHYDSVVLSREVMLGYVPKKKSAEVADFLKNADTPICKVTNFEPSAPVWNMIKVEIGEAELMEI